MNPTSPFSLPLAPIPIGRMENGGQPRPVLPDGFVDDEVIASLISIPSAPRNASFPGDLVLSSDENDFAGWSVPRSSPFRAIAERQEQMIVPVLPVMDPEPGIGAPHRGGHRWWIATATGISSALILSLLFGNLAVRGTDEPILAKLSKPIESVQSLLGSLAP